MITAAVSSVLGIIGGVIPDTVQWFKDRSDHKWEMERMQLETNIQLKLAEKQTTLRLSELDAEAGIVSEKAYAAQVQNLQTIGSQKVGVTWIDGFNALIRPTTASLVMILFIVIAGMYSASILEQVGSGTLKMDAAAEVLWSSLVGESIQAVLGYLFGYRSARKTTSVLYR